MKQNPAQLRELSVFLKAGIAPRESFAFSGLEGGIPKSALTEISGATGGGKTEAVLRFLSENPGSRVAWIEESFTIYPCAFPQNGVALERVLFVDAGPEDGESPALWAAHQILRSQVFGILILSGAAYAQGGLNALRRLQLAAEKSGVCVILLAERPTREDAWPISLQLEVHRGPEGVPVIVVLKKRGQGVWSASTG